MMSDSPFSPGMSLLCCYAPRIRDVARLIFRCSVDLKVVAGMSQFKTSARCTVLMLSVAGLLIVTACSDADGASTAGSSSTASRSGMLPGYQDQTTLEFSPLIISVLSPEVVPVKGSDGQYYVAYELSVFNAAPRAATMTTIETLAENEGGKVLSTADQEQIAANTMVVASTEVGTSDIPAGRTAIVVARAVYPTAEAIPAAFTHRIAATFAPAAPDAPRLASKYPDEVEQIGGAVSTSSGSPLVIGSPVAGGNWFANNGLDSAALNAHSDVLIPVGGRVAAAERYAIDFLGIDPATMTSYNGDPTLNESYLAFDQPLLAVADATVVRVVSGLPDVAPNTITPVDVIDDATGNQVVLDLGDGVYALYAHMKNGPAMVKAGDKVKKGQEIGRLGNSGNTSEAHLHVQLQRGPVLSAENVAWVIDSFTVTGVLGPNGDSVVAPPVAGPLTNQVPVMGTISEFAAVRR